MTWRLTDFLAHSARRDPDAVALETPSGAKLTYAVLDQRCGQAASWLRTCGVEAGDRVAVLFRNRQEFFEILFACARVGAVLAPLNWRAPAPELSAVLDDCAATLLIHEDDLGDVAKTAMPRHRVSLSDYVAGRDGEAAFDGGRAWSGDDVWYLIYTSGTTGEPKGVINTFGMAMTNFVNIAQAMSLRAQDRTLCHLPLYHTSGINLIALPLLMLGGSVVMIERFDADAVIEQIGLGGLTVFFSVPTIYRELADRPGFTATDAGPIDRWACGGAALPVGLAKRYADRGWIIRHGYGLTESGPTTLLQDKDSARRKPGSAGKPQILTRARIIDAQGQERFDEESGEIQLSGPGMTPGYWRRPELSNEMFTRDRWLKTGDIARRDADGDYYIVGRAKDMYVSGGANIYPAEVEAVLTRHPDVADAAVIAAPDERWGEVGHAFVEAAKGAHPETAALEAYCRKNLSGYKTPASFTVVDQFQRTPSGKIRKQVLRPPP